MPTSELIIAFSMTASIDFSNGMKIYVFNMDKVGNLKKLMDGENIGTLVK